MISYKNSVKKKISVIAAFYNEKDVVKNYEILSSYLKKRIPNYELIFVDDGSTVDTRHLQSLFKKDRRARLIRYIPNQGRGYAVTVGFRAAKGDYALYIDSDLDISPSHIPLIVEGLQTYDVVIGNKFHPQSRVRTRKVRRVASFVFNSIIRIFLKSSVTDHHVGIKGFRKEVIERLLPHVRERQWAFDVEILYLAQRVGYSIGYIPVRMTYGMEGIKLSYVRYLKELLAFINSSKNRYKRLSVGIP